MSVIYIEHRHDTKLDALVFLQNKKEAASHETLMVYKNVGHTAERDQL